MYVKQLVGLLRCPNGKLQYVTQYFQSASQAQQWADDLVLDGEFTLHGIYTGQTVFNVFGQLCFQQDGSARLEPMA